MTSSPEMQSRLVVLERDDCLRLLSAVPVGRLGVARRGRAPLVVPVNHVMRGEEIFFRTDSGTKLDWLRTYLVSFEVDGYDPHHNEGWSVLVEGHAYMANEIEIEGLELETWVGERAFWIRLVPRSITGRRIEAPHLRFDARGYF